MKVLHVAHGRKFDVWAMCGEGGECQVMDTLLEVSREHPDLATPIAVLLNEVVPHEGPPLHDEYRAKMVYHGLLYELKSDKTVGRKHLGLRVLFFFHGEIIVCTNAFLKSGNTSQDVVDLALYERTRFHEEYDSLEFVT
jgi:hypothetical protein